MLRGRFGNTTGRPYIEGRLAFPRFNTKGDISFLVDTGADRSVLMPTDAARLLIDYTRLQNQIESIGIGGKSIQYPERAIVTFLEQGKRLCVYEIDILIHAPDPLLAKVPSLLGRDIIQHWALLCDRTKNALSAEVAHVDIEISVPVMQAKLPPEGGLAATAPLPT